MAVDGQQRRPIDAHRFHMPGIRLSSTGVQVGVIATAIIAGAIEFNRTQNNHTDFSPIESLSDEHFTSRRVSSETARLVINSPELQSLRDQISPHNIVTIGAIDPYRTRLQVADETGGVLSRIFPSEKANEAGEEFRIQDGRSLFARGKIIVLDEELQLHAYYIIDVIETPVNYNAKPLEPGSEGTLTKLEKPVFVRNAAYLIDKGLVDVDFNEVDVVKPATTYNFWLPSNK